MSQSELHVQLTRQVAKELSQRYPDTIFATDILERPGDAAPPQINGSRPDVYGRSKQGDFIVIAEAKTDNDIENTHSRRQFEDYIGHIKNCGEGCMVLAVTGQKSDRAKTFLRFFCMEVNTTNIDIMVFDQFFFWKLEEKDRRMWHIN